MTFLDELTNYLETFRQQQVIYNYQICDLDEQKETGAAIVYMLNVTTDKVEELYFFVWKWNNTINYKQMDRLPTR